jgi:CRISPR-associated protein Cas2
MERISEYRVMWVLVFFDLPTETKQQRKDAAKFRKNIMGDGFTMFQFSIYIRRCTSKENAEAHRRRVRELMPKVGKIGIMTITDKQFGDMELYFGKFYRPPEAEGQQLELF